MIEEQLIVFSLDEFIERITFVMDRGRNFMNRLRNFPVLVYVVHGIKKILKRTFYQEIKKKKENVAPVKSFTISKYTTNIEVIPKKIQRTTTLITRAVSSPDISRDSFDDDDTEESSDSENNCDVLDYIESTIADLNPAAKQALDTIAQYVGYPGSGFAYFPLGFAHKGDQRRSKRD